MALDPTSSIDDLSIPNNSENTDVGDAFPSMHPMLTAANNHTIMATSGGSFTDRVSDGLTKGVASTLVSAGVSIANSAVSIGNLFGLDTEEVKTRDVLLSLDDDLAKYYDAHSEGIDIAGNVVSSLAPGLGGLKLLKLAQAGKMGKNMMSMTNVFRSVQDKSLAIAKAEIANGTIFDTYKAARLKAILAGAGEQALQGVAFEAAVAATMQVAPALNKDNVDYLDTITGFGKDVAIGAIFGGAIGGVFEAAAVKGQLNSFLRLQSKNIRPFEITADVERLDVDTGTKLSQQYYNLRQKEQFFDTGTPLSDVEFRTLAKTTKTMEENLRLGFQNLTGGDAHLANAMYDSMKDMDVDSFANALTASKKVGRVTDMIPDGIPAHIKPWDAPLVLRKNQLIYDISNTSSHGEVISTDGIVPGVSDFAPKGKFQVTDAGNVIADGHEFRLSGEKLEDMTPIQASTNWTSWALRSKKMKDDVVLDGNNLPMLQRALADQPKNFSIVNAGGQQIENINDLAIFVRQKKEDLVDTLLQKDKSIDEIARIADVDKSFVEDTTHGNWNLFATDKNYRAPQYAVASFNHAAVPDVLYMDGIANTEKRISLARENAYATTTNFFKSDVGQLPTIKVDTASPVDRASGFFTSSQGFYGTATAAAEQVGRFITQRIFQKHQGTVDALFAGRTAIQNDPRMLAEFNAVVGRMRGSSEKWVFDTTGLVFSENTLVARSYMQQVEKALLKAAKGDPNALNTVDVADVLARDGIGQPSKDMVMDVPKNIGDYLRTHSAINDSRVTDYKNLMNARGQTSSLSTGTIYVPPIDTAKQNFVAFVAYPEGKFGGTSEKAAMVAPTAEALQRKIDLIKQKYGSQFEVYTKADTERYFKIKGEYDSQFMLNEPTINSALAREGVLGDIVPRTDAYVFDEFERWHYRQTQAINRGMAELHYGQEFAELHALGQQYSEVALSRFKNESAKTIKNPYEDIIKTAMGISRLPENKLWMQLNEFAEQTATKAFNTVQEVFSSASQGKLDWKQANEAMEKYGYKAPFSDMYSLQLANSKIPQPVLQPFIQKMNSVLATAVLRLDFLDTVMNVISTPVLLGSEVAHIRNKLSDPEVVGRLNNLMNVSTPDGTAAMPSTFKLIGNAMNTYFRDGGAKMAEYKSAGWIKNELDLHRELMDTATLRGNETASRMAELGKKAVDIGVKMTGNDWSQGFTRFISANVMDQITSAAGIAGAEKSAYINTFLNRVMGNMTASQRPVLFQGAIGNAVGLFQTFQFNMAQNVFRYLETGDKKAAGMLLGMQNTLYGLQSNPAFYAINTHLVGSNTPGHEDIISGTYKVIGKETADWIMYGIGSNALQTNIYSRGDLTPRFASVIPTSIADIPIVNATAKIATGIYQTAQRLTAGGATGKTLLDGLAMTSINRPLAGIAQVASGSVVTPQAGNLISVSNDLFSMATMSRIAGGKPLDEAVTLDAMYRRNVYKSADLAKLETLGAALKTNMRGDGKDMTVQQWQKFSSDYVASGGRIDQFSGWVHRQMMAANTSVVNKARSQLLDPTVQNMMAVAGGEMPDFMNHPIGTPPPGSPELP